MKNNIIKILAILALTISACGGLISQVQASTEPSKSVEETPAPQDGTPGNGEPREVSDAERFVIGIFKLEGSDLAVTADQATSLIPLLNSMKELLPQQRREAENAGQGTPPAEQTTPPAEQATPQADNSEEMESLFEQMQAVLSDEQLQAIADLELDQDAVTTFMQEQGIEMGQPGQGGQGGGQTPPEGTPAGDMTRPEGTPSAGEGNGGGPGGGPGDGAPGQGGGLRFVSTELVDALIDLLQSKISS
jgi:hypothetical protein